ncbi:lactoylglutathione lyase [Xanthobacter agilis]|uniref:lactoylglutathione lyase n=1 Tax=Xanthobacter agilis TaxID=47492 RepID=A0ABU0LDA9_XANAG|nr:lactoylglutathione lyase [Xanthobacter agilis]MDQ0505132.1 lactoylglutathione lyase [Xanthobacter agilis]
MYQPSEYQPSDEPSQGHVASPVAAANGNARAAGGPALRIAVASRDGARIDQHFGQTETFDIYNVTTDGPALVERRVIAEHEREGEERRDTIYRLIGDCRMLLVAKIGATPQEVLASKGVEATDLHAGKGVAAALAEVFTAKTAAADAGPLDASDFRLLHTMLRVADLDRSIDFYTRQLGMTVLERREHKKNQFSQAYLGYGGGFAQMTLELVQNWQREAPYVAGDGFGHIAVSVSSITRLCDRLAAQGVPMPRPPRPQRHGESVVAFVEDPDGHRIELVQAPENA